MFPSCYPTNVTLFATQQMFPPIVAQQMFPPIVAQ